MDFVYCKRSYLKFPRFMYCLKTDTQNSVHQTIPLGHKILIWDPI